MHAEELEILLVTRVVFWFIQSPFFLDCTLEVHMEISKANYPKEIAEEIKESLYVDDLISEGVTHEEAAQFKMMANKLMKEGGFQWHSNIPDLKS